MRRLLPLVILLALLAALAFPAGAQGTIEHIVDRGETLSSIARHYQTTVRAIMTINPSIRNPNILWAGLRLQVPVGQIPGPDPMPPQPPQPPSGGICSYYVVRHGDTLTGIANWFAVSPWDIARANNILNLNHIYSGMYLAIPCSGGGVVVNPVVDPIGPQNVISYTVQPGDNLTRIANLNGTTVAAILALNGDAIPYGNYIYAGQVIQVPVGYVG